MAKELTAINKRAVFATGLVLVLANLLPMVYVGKESWSLMDGSPDARVVFFQLASVLLALYWVEIIVIGLLNMVRMLLIIPPQTGVVAHLWKLFFVPFFAAHFGFFCVGIGMAIPLVFGNENFDIEKELSALLHGPLKMLLWALFISHLFSFFWNYVAQREFQKTGMKRRMILPYVRTLPIAILAILGALVFQKVELPIWSLFVFIAVKTLTDLIVHVVMHFRTQRTS